MDIIPLVNDLEILGIFKDKDKKEGCYGRFKYNVMTTWRRVGGS